MKAAAMSLAVVATVTVAEAQGKGQGGDNKSDKGKARAIGKQTVQVKPGRDADDKGKARGDIANSDQGNQRGRGNAVGIVRGNAAPRAIEMREAGGAVERSSPTVFASSARRGQRLAGLAVVTAANRGGAADDFLISPLGDRVRVLNRSGVVLMELDDNRDIGEWRVVGVNDLDKKGAPSFCRSGEGHPVWGRQWCIDKGFGLGSDANARWARAIDPRDIVIRRRPGDDELHRDVLSSVLGDVVFNRLATHAVSLGLVEPLTGRWLGDATGPRVLLLSSGARPVAEIVDVDRDDRADMLVVALRPR
jgi:hypothetical protein